MIWWLTGENPSSVGQRLFSVERFLCRSHPVAHHHLEKRFWRMWEKWLSTCIPIYIFLYTNPYVFLSVCASLAVLFLQRDQYKPFLAERLLHLTICRLSKPFVATCNESMFAYGGRIFLRASRLWPLTTLHFFLDLASRLLEIVCWPSIWKTVESDRVILSRAACTLCPVVGVQFAGRVEGLASEIRQPQTKHINRPSSHCHRAG